MNKVEFNKYCAEVMGHDVDYWNSECNNGVGSYKTKHGYRLYNPYEDLNQMAEVFDNLWTECTNVQSMNYFLNLSGKSPNKIKQAMRGFIESSQGEG